MKRALKIVGIAFCVVMLFLLLILAYFTVREYRPKEVETIDAVSGERILSLNDTLTLTSWNIGYGGLGDTEDFFMDGGKTVQPSNIDMVEENLRGMGTFLSDHPSDIVLLQEVDRDSKRSYGIDQERFFNDTLHLQGIFAYNFKVDYVPFPLPPIGRVESGLLTLTDLAMLEAKRLSLPESFSWPVKTSNLKRGLLETRFPLDGIEKELVVFNLHLEAYDSGEGKIAQSKKLDNILSKEYEKGNYVIAGGDFNQVFEESSRYPDLNIDGWHPGDIGPNDIPEGFRFSYDDSVPTVRVLNQPFTGDYETSQVHVIDGFVVSDNIEVKQVVTTDLEFKHTDHHPVRLEVKFK